MLLLLRNFTIAMFVLLAVKSKCPPRRWLQMAGLHTFMYEIRKKVLREKRYMNTGTQTHDKITILCTFTD
jgi:hypothetical protein